jgi:chitinase
MSSHRSATKKGRPPRRNKRLILGVMVAAVLGAMFLSALVVLELRNSPPDDGRERVAYFADWNIEGEGYTLQDVEETGVASSLTTLLWAFGDVSEEGLCHVMDRQAWQLYQRRYEADESVSGAADEYEQPLAGSLNQLVQLREEYPHLRSGISLGGWNLSRYFSDAALTEESRRAFVESCIDLWIRGALPESEDAPQGGDGVAQDVFDGIDLDWEWPAGDGHEDNIEREEDRRNFTLMTREFRRALDSYAEETGEEVFLSVSLPNSEDLMRDGFEPEVFEEFDFIQVQGYDMTGPWTDYASPHSQLFTPAAAPNEATANSADAVVRRYLDYGVPPEKLVLGYPAFGRGWQGVGPEEHGRFQEAEGAAEGTYGEHTRSYADLEELPGRRFFAPETGAYWIYDGDEWWGYDNTDVVQLKGEYVIEEGLGGLMQWNLDQDPDGELVQAMDESLS